MPLIANTASKIPMMFRAQIEGRCQLQYAQSDDVERWADEWVREATVQTPEFGQGVQTRPYKISWRFITNGGQDDDIIRPVIGARGLPFYPGSSMKGAFRRACELEAPDCLNDYCGDQTNLNPGILRFHGGYPSDRTWTKNLIDVVHPQQGWQVGIPQQTNHSAKVLISLYKPELRFGISSARTLTEEEWQQIWQIWEKALSSGIGGRVSSGYGQPTRHSGAILYKVSLWGQGQTAQLLDGSTEFRPNIFRASLRGHALRIFGGLTTADTAEQLVDRLFGGIQGKAQVGLLGMAFHQTSPEPQKPRPTYSIEGDLKWLLTQPLSEEERLALRDLIKHLTQFAMLLGGFGKSWRRADHRLFMPDYDDHLIGCHWQWAGKRSPVYDNPVCKLEDVTTLINKLRETAKVWMQMQGITGRPDQPADWREAWYEENVQVWVRLADGADDSAAIKWLHGSYSTDYQGSRTISLSIKNTPLTGRLNQIGRLWHRMYPIVLSDPDPTPEAPKRRKPRLTHRYLELLTLFPDGTPGSDRFLQFLESNQTDFEKRW